jgi:DNA-binding beta-propeller fold protein YncE
MRLSAALCVSLLALNLRAGDSNTLKLVKTIPLPDVRGRIDHFAFDTSGQRLFMAALANDTVEVIDLASGKRVRTVRDCSEPQGLTFVPRENRLVIANGGSGVVQIMDAASFQTLKTIREMPDADNVRYDGKAGFIYVGYSDGALGLIQATNGELVASIKLPGHPESFQLEKGGDRIFVNVPNAGQIAVLDRAKRAVITNWPTGQFHANFPMALDEVNHRLFVGCRRPARLVVFDTGTGKPVSDVEISGDTDDLFYDAKRKRIYISCGGGKIDVVDQRDADTYQLRERISTVSGARTSFFSPETDELFLAVRAGMISGSAEVQIYKAN